MKLIYLKSALKCDSFDVAIDIKIQFFRVLVTIEPGRSLLQFVTTNCLIYWYQNSIFLSFWFLLSRVAPYYSSLPRTVWLLMPSILRGYCYCAHAIYCIFKQRAFKEYSHSNIKTWFHSFFLEDHKNRSSPCLLTASIDPSEKQVQKRSILGPKIAFLLFLA